MRPALALFVLCVLTVSVEAQCRTVYSSPTYAGACQQCAPPRAYAASPAYYHESYAPFTFEFRPIYAPVLALPGLNNLLPNYYSYPQAPAGMAGLVGTGLLYDERTGNLSGIMNQQGQLVAAFDSRNPVQAGSFPAITGAGDGSSQLLTAGPGLSNEPQKPTRAQVQALIGARCAACHSGIGKDGVHFFNPVGVWNPNVDRNDVLRVTTGARRKMPPDGALPITEQNLIAAWAAYGTSD
jgi:hypothetical protein